MKKIYFVRHGESEGNANNIIAGAEADVDLTDKGRAQARKAGFELKSKQIDLIVASPMSRTKETAEIIADILDYDRTKIIANKDFIEMFWGPYTGKHYDLRQADIDSDSLEPGVESAAEVHKRVTNGFEWLKKQPHNNIVLVSHGGTARMVRAIVEELPHHEFLKIEKLENSAIYEFEL